MFGDISSEVIGKNKTFGYHLSLLSRYAFEPVSDYKDDNKLVVVYSSLYSREVFESIKECAYGE